MSRNQPVQGFNPVRTLQKFVVSTFVICTFIAYALHEHFAAADTGVAGIAPPPNTPTTQQITPTNSPLTFSAPSTDPNSIPTAVPPTSAPIPTAVPVVPTPTKKSQGQYKDGTYTGPEVDAFYGLVQVQAIVQNGRISKVQFLDYPNDRRTSVRINTVAVPYLQSEAVQAQSANVDIISGATLTSEAFAQSLQTALNTAKN